MLQAYDADVAADGSGYVLLKGRAGMGNRILSLLTGILYARTCGRRLVVDWSDSTYSDDGSDVFPTFFECPLAYALSELPSTQSVAPELWRGQLDAAVGDLEQRALPQPRGLLSRRERSRRRLEFRQASTIDVSRLDYTEQVLVLWHMTSRVELMRRAHQGRVPGFPPGSSDAIMRDLVHSELALRPALAARVEAFVREQFDRPVVGVHLRFSDRRVRMRRILRRLDAMVEGDPDLSVFLATDNVEVKRAIEKRYYTVVTAPHWYPPAGAYAHGHDLCPDRVENGIEALVDLYLLAACDRLVCDSMSSFARVAILLTRPGTPVVDVQPRRRIRPLKHLPLRVRMRLEELRRGAAPRANP